MFALPLNRTTRHRLLVCLFLLTGLLATGAGVLPASAQRSTPISDDTTQRYGWVNGGIGAGRTGPGISVTGGVPIADPFYAGGRFAYTEEFVFKSPAPMTWDAGPLVGLVEQGRWGHLSLASGVAIVRGRRLDEPVSSDAGDGWFTEHYESHRITTLGIPLDVQVFFTPIQYLGIGVHGYANVNPDDNLLGLSVQLQVRLPQ